MSDDRLATMLATLEEVPVPVTWADVQARVADADARVVVAPEAPRSGHRRRWAVALGAVAALVAAVVLVWQADRDDQLDTGPRPPADAPPTPAPSLVPDPVPGPTNPTAVPGEDGPRSGAVTVVTDDGYLVWSGGSATVTKDDGFLVTADGHRTAIPPAPIAGREGATGVWTGSELIVCCGLGGNDGFPVDSATAAAWSPERGWRTLAPPPVAWVSPGYPASVWTGELMIVVSWGGAAAYDPQADSWDGVPGPPLAGNAPQAVWTGDEVIVWDGKDAGVASGAGGEAADHGWRAVPGADRWEALPELPPGARTSHGSIVWTGEELVVWGESTVTAGLGVGARWRPGDTSWAPLPPSPQRAVTPFEGTTGSQSIALDSGRGDPIVRGLHGNGPDSSVPLYRFDLPAGRWSDTGVRLDGYAPKFAVVGDLVVVPEDDRPVVSVLG